MYLLPGIQDKPGTADNLRRSRLAPQDNRDSSEPDILPAVTDTRDRKDTVAAPPPDRMDNPPRWGCRGNPERVERGNRGRRGTAAGLGSPAGLGSLAVGSRAVGSPVEGSLDTWLRSNGFDAESKRQTRSSRNQHNMISRLTMITGNRALGASC